MSKHIHADLMLQYAQDAQESETPWENWELRPQGSAWVNLIVNPSWHAHYEYRRKPRTIVINGFTVNAPMDKEPNSNQEYFIPALDVDEFYLGNCYNCGWDEKNFERGICFTNKEDAIAVAKAMLGIDPAKPD